MRATRRGRASHMSWLRRLELLLRAELPNSSHRRQVPAEGYEARLLLFFGLRLRPDSGSSALRSSNVFRPDWRVKGQLTAHFQFRLHRREQAYSGKDMRSAKHR